MKRLFLLLLSAGLLSACSSTPFFERLLHRSTPGAQAPAAQADPLANAAPKAAAEPKLASNAPRRAAVNSGEIQKVEFRPGISSATVERLAKNASCSGGTGAGLVTEPGPVEVYRMTCDNGKVFMARCELRQCQPMDPVMASR